MNILKPCSYHYLFSHIPNYTSAAEAKKASGELVFRLVTDLRLTHDKMEQFETPHPDVLPLSFQGDEDTQTYLLQFLSNDLITTILTFNQTEAQADAISYWQRTLRPNFPETQNRIGQTVVLFAQAETDITIVQEITKACFGGESNNVLPYCRFDWGTLYSLPESERHAASSGNSRQIARYVLLVPEAEHLGTGDQFLSLSFPMLEAIRQKLVYEEKEAGKFKAINQTYERRINALLDSINQELTDARQPKPTFATSLKQLDEDQATLYQNIANTEALTLTLKINSINFGKYLEALACQEDQLFAPSIPHFKFIRQQIGYDLQYLKYLLPGLDKREELLRLKIDWQRKAAEERSNRIKEITNALIFAFGFVLSIGQTFGSFNWKTRLLIWLAGVAAYLFYWYKLGERVKVFGEGEGLRKQFAEKMKEYL